MKVGVITDRKILDDNRPFCDSYNFVNNYVKRLSEVSVIPVGVLFPDGKFCFDYLDMYDGFLLTGGGECYSYHLAVVHFAVTNGKPLLGICLGHQAIGIYSLIVDLLNDLGVAINYESIIDFYEKIMDDDLFLMRVNGHMYDDVFYLENIDDFKHDVIIFKDTKLYEIYKSDVALVPSLHNYVLRGCGSDFVVSAVSDDGYIEAIEHKDVFVLGVQFHAELEGGYIFDRFVYEMKHV